MTGHRDDTRTKHMIACKFSTCTVPLSCSLYARYQLSVKVRRAFMATCRQVAVSCLPDGYLSHHLDQHRCLFLHRKLLRKVYGTLARSFVWCQEASNRAGTIRNEHTTVRSMLTRPSSTGQKATGNTLPAGRDRDRPLRLAIRLSSPRERVLGTCVRD